METVWKEIDLKVKEFEDSLQIPNGNLEDVPCVLIRDANDLNSIPNKGGCYWIWTDEPITHSFHNSIFPDKFDSGEIIYNGVTDNLRARIGKHLLGKVDEGMSAISIDLLLTQYTGSHRKKALGKTGNTPYYNNSRIREKSQLLNINLSKVEVDFVSSVDFDLFFRNGIDVTQDKHRNFAFKVYFLSRFVSLSFADIIERKWRSEHKRPRLCTYSKGR